MSTFRRTNELRRLLESFRRLEVSDDFTFEIVVADNDIQETARDIVDSLQAELPRLNYFVEPRQNISHARNCTVNNACGTWIAFIDDDEIADPNWLKAYWSLAKEKPADGYLGPVIPKVTHQIPDWLCLLYTSPSPRD